MMIGSWFSENSVDSKKTAKKNCESVNVDLEETNKKQKERIQRDENWVMNNTRKEEKLRSPWIRFFKRGPDSAKAKSMARGTHLRARCWNDYRWQMSSMLQNCSEEDSWEEWRLHIPGKLRYPSSLPIKTTQGVLLSEQQKVKGTRARRYRVHTAEEIS